MIHKRMKEARLNASLDACLRSAQEGDVQQARQLHEMLDQMLTGQDGPEGHMWLTDHARAVLAEMHRQLGHSEGDHWRDDVLDAVRFKPHTRHWDDSCSYLHDLRIAIGVANELCEQRKAGLAPDITRASKVVAGRGEFDLDPAGIRKVYNDIASTVGGFREISHC